MSTPDRRCERCGKRHLGRFTWLELNTNTGRFSEPGTVPEDESQGLFAFGVACAKRVFADGGQTKLAGWSRSK